MTYFFYLPKDIARLIDGLIRPITQRSLHLILDINLHVRGLSGGQEVICVRSGRSFRQSYEYRGVPDFKLVRPTLESINSFHLSLIDLQGPDDTKPIYSDSVNIILGNQSYYLYVSTSENIKCVSSTETPDDIKIKMWFDSFHLVRGADGYIYILTCEGNICCFHLSNPTQIKSLAVPLLSSPIVRLRSNLTRPLLYLQTNDHNYYQWNVATEEITRLIPPKQYDFICIDPEDPACYYFSNRDGVPQVTRANGEIIIDVNRDFPNSHIDAFFILRSGQAILQLVTNKKITTLLYG